MTWKRQVHAEHGTTLVETTSQDRQDGRLVEALAERLGVRVTLRPLPPEAIYDRVVETRQADDLTKLLGTFLRQFKGGGYTIEGCAAKAKALGLGLFERAFLAIFKPFLAEYQRRLGSRIDFEDMILRAAAHVESGRFQSPWRHILVDEFQDIARSRARLVQALKSQHADARIFAVGDDWQSIFRFTGSDVSLMRSFGPEFGGRFAGRSGVHRVVDLGRTFRSVDTIAQAARRFVLRNPAQIEKAVVAAGKSEGRAIRVVDHPKVKADEKLRDVLSELDAAALRRQGAGPTEGSRKESVLLLGRYRFTEPGTLADLRRLNPNLDVGFKTIHASKGLEADHVVVLSVGSGRTGFPSEIVDHRILSLVSPDAEPFPNAEERRVMYVAMTRARLTLTIMSSTERPSTFVRELRSDPAYGLAPNPTDETTRACAACGGRLVAVPAAGGRVWHRCEHDRACGHYLPACPSCGTGLPARPSSASVLNSGSFVRRVAGRRAPPPSPTAEARCGCGAAHPACPSCEDGWLVERGGRHGAFLGCVNFPDCTGKAQVVTDRIAAPRSTRPS